jgi:prevent-host-death family protein
MKKATISDAKNNLSAYLDFVRRGETVIIMDRNCPVARLEPVYKDDDATGRLSRLERAGLIRRGSGKRQKLLTANELPMSKISVLEALLKERREGR